jgi:hypothetical protein
VEGRWIVAADDPHRPSHPLVLDWSSETWLAPAPSDAPHAVRLLGWSADELRAIPVSDLLHPDDRDVLDELATAEPDGRFVPLELRVLGRDARYWWTRWWRRDTPSLQIQGATYLRPSGWACPVGSWRWQVEREVVTWSAEVLDMFGVRIGPPAHVAAFLASVHDEDQANAGAVLRRAVQEHGTFAYTFRTPGREHDRVFYAAGRCRVDADGGLVVAGLVKYLNPPPTPRRGAATGCG